MTFHKHLNPVYLAHKNQKKYDHIAYIVIGISFLFALPQIYQIYETQSAEDISLITWVGYFTISIFWLIYGIERKVNPIIISSLIHLGTNLIMVYGIVQYGGL